MIGSLLSDRYLLQAELGRGGMGTVYRAHDAILKRDVAVKVLTSTSLGSDGQLRLLQEARAAAGLNHPNIVAVHDAGEHNGTPFVVMELVDGPSLHERPPDSLEETTTIATQICAALDHAHSHNIVHRDLKPENVLLSPDGAAKLVDFGLARSLASRLTSEGSITGTVLYLAPELALGQSYDGRADLYSLGVMLYELTTGELPFSASDPVAVISQHLHAPVVPPRAKNPQVPTTMDALIVRLLSKRPEDRPGSANEVLEALEQVDAPAVAGRDLGLLDRFVRGRFVGRQRELAEARTLWGRAAHGEGQVLLVSGEPGIGKSRLTRELVTQVEVSGGQALVGECWAEVGAPYEPFAQILRRSLRSNGDAGLALPDFVLADLLTLTPDLQPYFPDVPPNPSLEPEAEQQRLFENVVAFCDHLSQSSPLLLVLEDAHWADGGSLSLLRHLARSTRRRPILLVATYREIELDEARPLQEVLIDLNRERLATRLKLTRLDREQTEDLLTTMLAEEITPEFLEGIYRETEGNPFFIEEVCRALVESGELTFVDGRWHRPDMRDLAIPQSIKTAVGARVKRLSEACRDALTMASVIGREFDFDLLQEATGIGEDALLDLIDEALRAQLIDEKAGDSGELFIFRHALIAHTLYDGLNRRRQARMHEIVGLATERLYAGRLEQHIDQLAYHFFLGARGREIDRAVQYALQAGEQAVRIFAYDDAARYFEQAINLLEDAGREPETIALWERLGDLHRLTLDRTKLLIAFENAIRLWEELPPEDAEVETGVRLYTKIAEVSRWGARHENIRLYVEKGLELVGSEKATIERARLLSAMALYKYFMISAEESDYVGAEQAAEEALAIATELDDPVQMSAALDALSGTVSYQGDSLRAWEISRRRLDLMDRLTPLEQLDVIHMTGQLQQYLAEFATAEDYNLRAMELGKEKQLYSWRLQKDWDQIQLYIDWNRWPSALETIQEYIDLTLETGGRFWTAGSSIPNLCRLASALCDLRLEPERSAGYLELGSTFSVPDIDLTQSPRIAAERFQLFELLQALDRLQEARLILDLLESMGLGQYALDHLWLVRAELAIAEGEPMALEYAAFAQKALRKSGRKLLQARARRAGAIAQALSGSLVEAKRELRASLAEFEAIDTPWQQGRTLVAMGRLAQDQGQADRARHHFQRALALFEAMEARFDARKVRKLLHHG